MINFYILKKWGAIILCCIIPANAYMLGTSMFKLTGGLIALGVSVLISAIITNLLLKNPFNDVLEGKGLLVVPIDSTGLAHPLIVQLNSKNNKLSSISNNIDIDDIFDRDIAHNMTPPIFAKNSTIKQENGNIIIQITNEDYNKSKFGLLQYPLLFWNKQLGSFITKDQVSDFEKNTLTSHPIYRYNMNTNTMIRDLLNVNRGVVDAALQPEKKNGFLSSPWMILLLVVFIAIMIFLFLPKILPQFAQGLGSITQKLAP